MTSDDRPLVVRGGPSFEMTGAPSELTLAEAAEFERLDVRLQKTVAESDLVKGQLLREIKARRLWRSKFPTWESYVRARIGRGRRHADRLIAYAQLREEWDPGVPFPPGERHGRPFVALTAEERRLVIDKLDGAFASVTVKAIEVAVTEVTQAGAVARRETAPSVLTRRGPVTLGRSGIMRDLDEVHARLLRIAKLGEHAIPDAVRALDVEEAAERLRMLEADARVLGRAIIFLTARVSPDETDKQERFFVPEDGMAVVVRLAAAAMLTIRAAK